jgi:hypothetical protein
LINFTSKISQENYLGSFDIDFVYSDEDTGALTSDPLRGKAVNVKLN